MPYPLLSHQSITVAARESCYRTLGLLGTPARDPTSPLYTWHIYTYIERCCDKVLAYASSLCEGRSVLTAAVNAHTPCSLVPDSVSPVKALKDGVLLSPVAAWRSKGLPLAGDVHQMPLQEEWLAEGQDLFRLGNKAFSIWDVWRDYL